MNTPDKYVAFFDLDRTMIREISGNEMVRRAWRKGIISRMDIATALSLYLVYKLNIMDPLKIIDEMAGWAKGMPETELDSLCQEVTSEVLLPSLFSEAVREISIHKENNARVIILSSALDSVCRVVSESLGMNGYVCSSLEAENGYLTGKPLGRICFGEEKLNRLIEYCKANTMNPEDSWYYADSISDLSVLCVVGNPVCVNPDRQLKKEALGRGWKILSWNH